MPGCRKDDNSRVPDFIRVPLPLITKDASKDQIISAQEPTAFTATFVVDMMYKDQPPPKSVEAVVIKNGDKTKVVSLQKDITTFPTSINITGQQLIDAFGDATIELGDRYDFGVNITLDDGTLIQAFPAGSTAYAPGVGNQPGVSTTVRYEAVCSFTAADYAGTFEVVTDEWADYGAGDEVEVTVVDETTLSFEFLTDPSIPILVKVDPADNSTSVVKQVYGDYPQFGITEISAESVEGSADNFVAPCEGILSVRLNHTDAATDYGDYTIVLKKIN